MADTKIREMNLWILQTLPPPSLWLSNTALQTPVMQSQGDAPCHLPISPHITLSGKHTDIFCCIHLVPAGEDVEEITQAGLSWHFLNNGNNAHCCHLSLLPLVAGYFTAFPRESPWGGRKNITWLLLSSIPTRPFSLMNYHLSYTTSSIVWFPLKVCLGSLFELSSNLSLTVFRTEN